MTEPDESTPSGSRTAIWVVIPVAVAMAMFVLLLATRDPGNNSNADEFGLQGTLAPEIVGTTLDGSTYNLDDDRGSYVVVNFFATTCIPCLREHPELIDFHEANAPSGAAKVVSVNFGDTTENVETFFAENGGDWPVVIGDTTEVAVSYGTTGIPESVIVDPTGRVVTRVVGGVTRAYLESLIVADLEDQQTEAGS